MIPFFFLLLGASWKYIITLLVAGRLVSPMATAIGYRKLDLTTNEIRLIRLLPAPATANYAAIQCVLQYASLSNPPSYIALSYQWGDQKDTVPILIGDHTFLATRNLANALRNLRARGHQQVWVDAICINQCDIQERSEQINRMAAVYQCADEVIAWLGEDVEVQEKAFPMMERMYRTTPTSTKYEVFGFEGCDDSDRWRAVIKFFENSYWRRVWIIQELAFGSDVQLVCGPKCIPFKYLAKTVEVVKKYRLGGDHFDNPSFEHVGLIKEIRSRIEASKPIPLLEAMARSSRAECTEIPDRLYGLFGLVSSHHHQLSNTSLLLMWSGG
jgi:hypothetical protein